MPHGKKRLFPAGKRRRKIHLSAFLPARGKQPHGQSQNCAEPAAAADTPEKRTCLRLRQVFCIQYNKTEKKRNALFRKNATGKATVLKYGFFVL
ncbi:hypothetical protein DRA42_00735 [Ethanoligenens harbinense]|nr:hypothetical protein CXQ68_00720 [Ethanoligenens harbinense YUAN-3]AYF37591.1 hypothetical protein CXP51_00725 [Ethanoligenens harbinense]AYF40311.1 hypothetical protein CN246_00720 [Ethanoligenens harbinense]QCN91148.1 hypothetical protein DRA42_00735 [Ethanoligenens harbinense]